MNNTGRIWRIAPHYLLLLIGFTGIVLLYLSWEFIIENRYFDRSDLDVYFKESRWVVGQGVLYKEVFSEYPLLANLIFGFVRFSSELLHPLSSSYHSFTLVWVSFAWCLYLGMTYLIITKTSAQSLLIWLAPGVLFLSLLRFDIYPSITTFLFFVSLKQEKYFQSAFWLGITIAVKGYALFTMPAYFVFLFYKKGFWGAVKLAIFTLFPFVFCNIIVFAYAGYKGFIMPYAFHASRRQDGASTYDAISYLSSFLGCGSLSIPPKVAQLLQILTSLIAAGLRPKRFKDVVDAFLLSIVGFLTFHVKSWKTDEKRVLAKVHYARYSG